MQYVISSNLTIIYLTETSTKPTRDIPQCLLKPLATFPASPLADIPKPGTRRQLLALNLYA